MERRKRMRDAGTQDGLTKQAHQVVSQHGHAERRFGLVGPEPEIERADPAIRLDRRRLDDQEAGAGEREMPEMDGFILTKKIKSDRRFAGVPVLMHSSLSGMQNQYLGKSVGVDEYVPKFHPRELAETLQRLFAKRQETAKEGRDGQSA